MAIRARRLLDRPIVTPDLDPGIGVNIQGPSLIRMPDWIPDRLGQYYLYFADHKGSYIRLAYADALTGPWHIHPPGSLHLKDSCFPADPPVPAAEELARFEERFRARGAAISHDVLSEITTPHIASPDVHIDENNRRIVMYFHGLDGVGIQVTRAARSADGLHFQAEPPVLVDRSYFRAFDHDGRTYGLAMPGQIYRDFQPGPALFNPNMRHAALLKRGQTLYVFWTQVGDVPERILVSRIDLSGDWNAWKDSEPAEVLRPELPWEGADAPLAPSIRSTAYGEVNQLRDPAIFEENGRVYLLYAVAGESGIAIAEVFLDEHS